MEGILTYDFGIDCARFVGDVDPDVRNEDLDRFKASSSCRVLLMTVQSGGTGLNIVEASSVCFLDRWFNPTVHAQAQDRCHRIGQKRPVNIFFADVATTIDEVMALLNDLKSANAKILLADGTELAQTADGSLSYQELAGKVGDLMRAVKSLRHARAKEYYDLPLPPLGRDGIEAEVEAQKLARRKAVKSESAQAFSVESTSSSAAAAVATAEPGSSCLSSSSEDLKIEPQMKHHYETIGGTNVLVLSDSDDDDSLFDMQPTFKTG